MPSEHSGRRGSSCGAGGGCGGGCGGVRGGGGGGVGGGGGDGGGRGGGGGGGRDGRGRIDIGGLLRSEMGRLRYVRRGLLDAIGLGEEQRCLVMRHDLENRLERIEPLKRLEGPDLLKRLERLPLHANDTYVEQINVGST